MGSNGVGGVSFGLEADCTRTIIEINIKTLDSKTYTLQVDKQVPVPALKEQIASVTGILSDQQRLICHGRVLKDDQLLSAYHVEDGHTLHLVVRQQVPPLEGLPDNSDPTSSGSPDGDGRLSHSIVVEAFNVPDQGDIFPDFGRIVSAVLGSFGTNNVRVGGGSGMVDIGGNLPINPNNQSTASNRVPPPDRPGISGESGRPETVFSIPSFVSLGSLQPPVIPGSLATMSQYIRRLKHEFEISGTSRNGEHDVTGSNMDVDEEGGTDYESIMELVQEGQPTLESLAVILLFTRDVLLRQTSDCFLSLARELNNHGAVTDTSMRSNTQANALRSGVLIQNLGAFLLELGRTTMTVRMGMNTSEAVVNAGPAVFISQSGPNPLMVQPLPFQPGTSFSNPPTEPSRSVNGLSAGFVPRRIDIQIRRGSPSVGNNVNQEQTTSSQILNLRNTESGVFRENPLISLGSEIRVIPVRTMVAAIPNPILNLSSELSGSSLDQHHPVFGRFHTAVTRNLRNEMGSQSSHFGQDGMVQDHDIGASTVEGLATESNAESDQNIRNGVVQYLRNLFPGDGSNSEDVLGPIPTDVRDVIPRPADTSNAQVTEEGLFLSNMLRQFLPLVLPSEPSDIELPLEETNYPIEVPSEETNDLIQVPLQVTEDDSSHVYNEPGPPSPKRRKME